MSDVIDDTLVITDNLLALAVAFLESYQDHYGRRWHQMTIAQVSYAGYPCRDAFQAQLGEDSWWMAGPALRAAHAALLVKAQKELPL